MSDQSYRGAVPPVKAGPPVYAVLAPERGQLLDVTLLDEMILGVWSHWTKDAVKRTYRSVGCLHFEGECRHCQEGIKRKWLGFVGVWNHVERRREVLRLGPEGSKRVAFFRGSVGGLRGVRLEIKPSAVGVIGGLDVTPARSEALVPLISPHKIIPTVCLLLKVDSIDDGWRSAEEVMGDASSDENGGVT